MPWVQRMKKVVSASTGPEMSAPSVPKSSAPASTSQLALTVPETVKGFIIRAMPGWAQELVLNSIRASAAPLNVVA